MATVPAEFQERLAGLGVREDDLRLTAIRASGPGGQHVNKVSTAIELVHEASGIRVVAGDSRSQHRNRLQAFGRLVEELTRRREANRQERLAAISKGRRQRAKRSRGTQAKVLEGKRRRGETKKLRGRVDS